MSTSSIRKYCRMVATVCGKK